MCLTGWMHNFESDSPGERLGLGFHPALVGDLTVQHVLPQSTYRIGCERLLTFEDEADALDESSASAGTGVANRLLRDTVDRDCVVLIDRNAGDAGAERDGGHLTCARTLRFALGENHKEYRKSLGENVRQELRPHGWWDVIRARVADEDCAIRYTRAACLRLQRGGCANGCPEQFGSSSWYGEASCGSAVR